MLLQQAAQSPSIPHGQQRPLKLPPLFGMQMSTVVPPPTQKLNGDDGQTPAQEPSGLQVVPCGQDPLQGTPVLVCPRKQIPDWQISPAPQTPAVQGLPQLQFPTQSPLVKQRHPSALLLLPG